MSKPKYLALDIETIPTSEIAGDWEPSKRELEMSNGSPFPPVWTHRVLCIGMLALDANLIPLKGGCAAGGLTEGASEKEMIERWSHIASGKMHDTTSLRLVDWNGRGFDMPVLQTRAFRYGVPLKWYFGKLPDNKGMISSFSRSYRDRYAGRHMDLADVWTNCGAFQRPHLANLAKLMGLPGKVGIDGSKVKEAFEQGRLKEIDIYCMQDTYQTAFILQRFLLLKGDMSLDAYRKAAESLHAFIAQTPDQKEFAEQINMDELLLR